MHHKFRFHTAGGDSRRHFGRFRSNAAEQLSTPEGRELWKARTALKAALRDKQEAAAEEQQRIVAILLRATAEILGKPAN